ncbi:CapA family protein [Krasilnikovia sp. M28-CT-15]|uniref:CapA family protein n=1 Tax=Krasilnikovia sp. M28-CT-15 TaxID=3373540 RepID=UPI00387710B0
MRIAFTGDLLITTDLSVVTAAGRLDALRTWLGGADAVFGNLETVIHDYQFPPAARAGGTWLRAPVDVAAQLAGFGVSAVSVANNHSCDYGTDGLLHSIQALHAAGIATAGGGPTLTHASAPARVPVAGTSVATVAATTTAPLEASAADEAYGIPARPGVFRIAFSDKTVLPSAQYDNIAEIARMFDNATPDDELVYDGTIYVRGDRIALVSTPHPDDLRQLVSAVTDARSRSDMVTVSLHSHEGNGRWEEPSDVLVALAHAAADAGASVVWCHGPHLVRGVERRGDAIIFYSLGSLFFQVRGVDRQPAAMRRLAKLPADATLPQIWAHRYDYLARPAYRESIVPVCTWTGGRLTGVQLAAFILDHTDGDTYGLPRPATAEEANTVAGRINELSAGWSTKVSADHTGTLTMHL